MRVMRCIISKLILFSMISETIFAATGIHFNEINRRESRLLAKIHTVQEEDQGVKIITLDNGFQFEVPGKTYAHLNGPFCLDVWKKGLPVSVSSFTPNKHVSARNPISGTPIAIVDYFRCTMRSKEGELTLFFRGIANLDWAKKLILEAELITDDNSNSFFPRFRNCTTFIKIENFGSFIITNFSSFNFLNPQIPDKLIVLPSSDGKIYAIRGCSREHEHDNKSFGRPNPIYPASVFTSEKISYHEYSSLMRRKKKAFLRNSVGLASFCAIGLYCVYKGYKYIQANR